MTYIRTSLRKLKPKCVICGNRTHYKKGYGWKCDSPKCAGRDFEKEEKKYDRGKL